MKTNTLVLAASLLVAACNGTADDDIDVDSRAVCDCPEQTAADVAYDNVGSGLAGADVQDAVDELAARPEGLADAYDRVFLLAETSTSAASGTTHTLQVLCPASPPDNALALGGGCDANGGGTALVFTDLQNSGYTCVWSKPEGAEIEFTAKVRCLGKAGVSYE